MAWIRSWMIRVVRLCGSGQALSPFVCLSSLHLVGLFVAIGRRWLVFASRRRRRRGAVIRWRRRECEMAMARRSTSATPTLACADAVAVVVLLLEAGILAGR